MSGWLIISMLRGIWRASGRKHIISCSPCGAVAMLDFTRMFLPSVMLQLLMSHSLNSFKGIIQGII